MPCVRNKSGCFTASTDFISRTKQQLSKLQRHRLRQAPVFRIANTCVVSRMYTLLTSPEAGVKTICDFLLNLEWQASERMRHKIFLCVSWAFSLCFGVFSACFLCISCVFSGFFLWVFYVFGCVFLCVSVCFLCVSYVFRVRVCMCVCVCACVCVSCRS